VTPIQNLTAALPATHDGPIAVDSADLRALLALAAEAQAMRDEWERTGSMTVNELHDRIAERRRPGPHQPTRGAGVVVTDDIWVLEPAKYKRTFDAPRIEHLAGVPWFEAPIPRKRHRCRAQTRGLIGFEMVHRCACGAIQNHSRFPGSWLERNSSRKATRRPVPDTPYIERKQREVDEFNALFTTAPTETE